MRSVEADAQFLYSLRCSHTYSMGIDKACECFKNEYVFAIYAKIWLEVIILFVMPNSAEHEIYPTL